MSPPHLAFPLEVIRKNPLGGDLPSSSTLLDPASSSTLRARLQSPQLVAQVHHSSAATCRPDSEVFQHFRSCFAYAKPSVVQQSVKAKKPSDGDNGTLAQLREAFAEAGLQCYTSVAREIMDSHVDLVSRIDTLARESLALTKRTSLAYANLVPLSATLCCGEDVPSTTLATHLSVVVTAISQAQEQLGDLQAEWTCCLAEEEQTLAGLWDAEDKAEQKQTRGDVEAKAFLETVASRLKLFREGVDGIVHNSQSLLDKIDVEFRELIRGETMSMMQRVMRA